MPRTVKSSAVRTLPAPAWKKLPLEGSTDIVPVLVDIFRNPSGVVTTEKLAEAVAKRFAANLRRIIRNQSYAWVPHSPAYAAYKRRNKLDPRIFIASSAYINSIQAVRGEDGSWSVSVPDTPITGVRGKKYTMRDLARWLEFGTLRMPARPMWRPALAAFKAEMHQVGDLYRKMIRELAIIRT